MKPIKYRVLLAEQLSKADKVAVAAELASLKTGDEACNLAKATNLWQCEVKDHLGRVRAMLYRGAEVALFYQRQIATLEPLPQDPVPEGIIDDPKDAWMRIDLLGVSPRNLAARVGKAAKSTENLLDIAMRELKVKDELNELLNHEIFKLNKKLEAQDKELIRLRKKVKTEKTIAA